MTEVCFNILEMVHDFIGEWFCSSKVPLFLWGFSLFAGWLLQLRLLLEDSSVFCFALLSVLCLRGGD